MAIYSIILVAENGRYCINVSSSMINGKNDTIVKNAVNAAYAPTASPLHFLKKISAFSMYLMALHLFSCHPLADEAGGFVSY